MLKVLCLIYEVSAHGNQERVLGPQELELWTAMASMWVCGELNPGPLEVLFPAEPPLQPSMHVMKERLNWKGGKGPARREYGGRAGAEGSGNTDENSSS